MSNVFRYRNPGSTSNEPDALREVLSKQPEIIVALCNGYDRRESASPCGGILKEALKHDAVAAVILYHEASKGGKTFSLMDVDTVKPSTGDGVFWKFFEWIDKSSFEVSADAFDTFRVRPLIASRSASRTLLMSNRSSLQSTSNSSHSTLVPTLIASSASTTTSSSSLTAMSPNANPSSCWAKYCLTGSSMKS